MKSQTVLVTGASGFLGNAIAQSMVAEGHRVISCVNPNTSPSRTCGARICRLRFPDANFGTIVLAEKPDWLIHCAGSASVAASVRNPAQDWHANVETTASIYRALSRYSPNTRIIFFSSAAVYGQPTAFPITEKTPVAPISPYGENKRACEQLGIDLTEQQGIEVINLRIFSAYGSGLEKQVLWDIFQKAKQSSIVLLDGDGTETRDLIHVQDIVRLVNRLICDDCHRVDLLNVATGTSTDIASLAGRFLHALGMRRELRFSGRRSIGVPIRWEADTSLLMRLIEKPQVTLDVGLSEYANWLQYQEGGDNARRVLAAAG